MTEKVKLHEIAEELGISSKDVMRKAINIGIKVSSPQSELTMKEAETLVNFIMNGEDDFKLYIAYLPHVEEDIDKEFNEDIKSFFEKEFLKHDSFDIYNFGFSKNKQQQVALTHKDTNLILLAEQSVKIQESGLKIVKKNNGEVPKDNYLLCTKIYYKSIVEKNSQIKSISNMLNECDKVEIKANLIIDETNRLKRDESSLIINNEKYDVTSMMNLVELLSQSNSVEDTKEYKKWLVYLRLLEKKLEEKSASFEVNLNSIERIDDITIKVNKPNNQQIKFQIDDEILINYDDEVMPFGKVVGINKNKIEIELNKDLTDFKTKTIELFVNHIGTRERLRIFDQAMKQIRFSDFRFYIFGDQKLPAIKECQKIKFENNLNQYQQEAVIKAVNSEKLFMIQGPPGTGKTTVIAEIAYQERQLGHKVLISSESNDAVENALERLNKNDFYPLIYQSQKREEKTLEDILPTESKAGSYYKKKIIDNLLKKIESTKLNQKNDFMQEFESKIQDLQNKKRKFREIEDDMNLILEYERNQDIKINQIQNEYDLLTQQNQIMKKFISIQEDFYIELTDNEESEKELRLAYLDLVNVVGATLGQINKASKNDNNFDVIIVDEVSKAMPIELALAVLNAKKVIFVGDQKQLPPMLDRDITMEEFAENVFHSNDDEYDAENEVLQELHQHVTIFEKLIERNLDNYIRLNIQYRMHEKIQKAINSFYDEELECGVDNSLLSNKHELFDAEPLVWIDTKGNKEIKQGTSYFNEGEIEYTKKILSQLNNEYENDSYKPSVGVITFYGSQVKRIANIGKNFKNLNIDYGTVDTFQGQERDFIIVSMVRSESIGFARSLNRINVAFSRAKQLLVILGDSEAFCKINNYDREDIKKAKNVYKSIYDISYKGLSK